MTNLPLPVRLFAGLLLFAFVLVPVFQSAHMLTHIEAADVVSDGALAAQEAHMVPDEGSVDADSDFDKVCLDCLALAAFTVLLPTLTAYFSSAAPSLLIPHADPSRRTLDFSAPYLSRAPPQS